MRLIRRHGPDIGLTTARGNNGQRSLYRHASWHSNPRENPPAPATPLPEEFDPKTLGGMLARSPRILPKDAFLKDRLAPLGGATTTQGAAT